MYTPAAAGGYVRYPRYAHLAPEHRHAAVKRLVAPARPERSRKTKELTVTVVG